MRINHNIAALNTYRQLTSNNRVQQNSLEKLSSGLRINSAADDAAGLAISEKMRGQIRGLDQATRNAQDGISLIQTAEGALNETHSILQRMRELAVQSSNDTNTETDRIELQKEVDQLASELSRITNNTEFNTKNLLGGSFDGTFHIGANEDQSLGLSINAMDAETLGVADNVASVSAKVDDTTGLIKGMDMKDNVALTEGTYSLTVDADNGTATLTLNGEEVANGSYTAGTDQTITLNDGTSDIATIAVDLATTTGSKTTNVTIGASGADITAAGTNINTMQVSSGSLEAGDYKLRVYDTDSTATISFVAELQDSDGNVISTSSELGTSALTDTTSLTADFTVNGEAVNIDFSVDALADNADDIAEFTVTQSDYKSGSSSAAVDSDGDGVLDQDAVVAKGIDIRTQTNADAAITKINDAIETVSAERAKLGAYQNRLEHTINNLGTSSENLVASESRIRDVDMAKEMMEFTKTNILSQAAQAMLAQANQLPQGVLQLLR